MRWFLWTSIIVFGIAAKIIFDKVNDINKTIVDEEFHLPLGQAYCEFKFDQWHPKITTLPGLYLLSSLILGPWGKCTIYNLRSISLVASLINIYLFYLLLKEYNKNSYHRNVIAAINLALLPPLYFFSNFYYTDVVSLTMILFLLIFAKKGNHYLASIFGMFAILFRQNNIIWVGMILGSYVLRELHSVLLKKPNVGVTVKTLKLFIRRLGDSLKQTSLQFWLDIIAYLAVLIVFGLFVLQNGGIVVGDRCAHQTTIHLTQIFYFSLFTLFFAWPHFIEVLPKFYNFSKTNKTLLAFILILSLLIVHYNTLVHPYLLADNRHYLFYIWNRFYGKYQLFRYLIVPVYIFALYGIITKIWHQNDLSFLLFLIPCTIVALTTQKLLEFRYFFIPFIIFKALLKETKPIHLFLEFLTYFILNCITMYLFFTKTIMWEDYNYPQRLIW